MTDERIYAFPAWKIATYRKDYAEDFLTHLKCFDKFSLPINVAKLLERLDVEVYTEEVTYDFPTWEMTIQKLGNEARIWVNSSSNELQRRFALAFGLGAILFHGDSICQKSAFELDEIYKAPTNRGLVSSFAFDLLMPKVLLDEYVLNEYDMGIVFAQSTETLEEIFGVPKQILVRRILSLYNKPVSFIK